VGVVNFWNGNRNRSRNSRGNDFIVVVSWKARNYSKYGTEERKKKLLYNNNNNNIAFCPKQVGVG
jgi:hypothetical protein